MGIIYKIENMENGKVYIGQTVQTLRSRMSSHIACMRSLNNYVEGSLYYDMHLYGVNKFRVDILERCDNSKLSEREIYYINKYDSYNNGYNRTRGGATYIELNEQIREKAINMINSRMTATEIASTLGYSLTTILKIARSEGIDIVKDSGRGPIKIIQYTLDYKPIKMYNSISEAYRFIDSGVSESTFQHNIRFSCGTGKSLYGYYWAMVDNLMEEIDGKLYMFKSPADKENYLNGDPYIIDGEIIITDISKQINKKQEVMCRFCGKQTNSDIAICKDCAIKHPRSKILEELEAERRAEYLDKPKTNMQNRSIIDNKVKEHKKLKKLKHTLSSKLPDKETLQSLIEQYSYAEICRMYGVYERTLRDKLREYGIYKEKINRNADEIQIIRDVLTHGRVEAAKLNNVSTWKVDNILDKYKIPSWLFDNSKPVRAINTFTNDETIFISFKEAARAISTEDATASAINSLGYKIGKAAQEGRVYKGYYWSMLNKQAFIGEILLKLGNTN